MKKMLSAALSIVLSAGLILTILVFGFNFRNIEQDKTYATAENFGDLFANWYAGNGNNDAGWCVGKFGYYKVTVKDHEYVLDFLGTSI